MKAVLSCMVVGLGLSTLWAYQPPNMPGPEKEHTWLKQFIGEWETDSEANMGPGQPAMKCKGSLKSRALGEFWIVTDFKAMMMGTEMTGLQQIGYNPQKKKYIGTWIDAMMNHMWVYEGEVDTTGKILTLEAEGPNMLQPGKTAKFRDIYEFASKDEIKITSAMQGEDGKWMTFMTGTAKRKK